MSASLLPEVLQINGILSALWDIYIPLNFFFLIYCCTYNLIRLVSFKVPLSTFDTPLPAFYPVLERVLERVLRDGGKVL